ncbi:MAG: squalene--hopene cyclase, partial [Terriglobia bacterium]
MEANESHAGLIRDTPPVSSPSGLKSRVQQAVARTTRYLLSLQKEPGYWLAELGADTTLESDYILYLHLLDKARPSHIALLANTIRREQLPDGGWNLYHGGPSELNATVKAYFALQLAGDSCSAPHMLAARRCALDLGGLERTNSFARFYLALCGKVGWDLVPAMPPELILLPRWFFFNIFDMSSWTRCIVVPLTILYALKPDWRLPERVSVDELFKARGAKIPAFRWDPHVVTWRNFFLLADVLFKVY